MLLLGCNEHTPPIYIGSQVWIGDIWQKTVFLKKIHFFYHFYQGNGGVSRFDMTLQLVDNEYRQMVKDSKAHPVYRRHCISGLLCQTIPTPLNEI